MHDQTIAGPLSASNKCRAKGLVAEAALAALSDPNSELALAKICTCGKASAENAMQEVGEEHVEDDEVTLRDVRERKLDLETTDGCALAGALRVAESDADALSDVLTFDRDDEEPDLPTESAVQNDERCMDVEDNLDDEHLSSPLSTMTIISDFDDYQRMPALSQSSMFEVELLLAEVADLEMEQEV